MIVQRRERFCLLPLPPDQIVDCRDRLADAAVAPRQKPALVQPK
jgi:hypothetical protein